MQKDKVFASAVSFDFPFTNDKQRKPFVSQDDEVS